MLKILSYIAVIFYLVIQYGQNLLEFGSDLRIQYYFVGMSVLNILIAFIVMKSFKNIATSFYMFLCVGAFINELWFNGSLSYIDIVFGLIGVVYLFIEKRILKWLA